MLAAGKYFNLSFRERGGVFHCVFGFSHLALCLYLQQTPTSQVFSMSLLFALKNNLETLSELLVGGVAALSSCTLAVCEGDARKLSRSRALSDVDAGAAG